MSLRRHRRRGALAWLCVLALGGALAGACDAERAPDGDPDPRLVAHAVEPSTPSPGGLAYIETMASVHARAEAADAVSRVSILRQGLAVPVPADLAEAEILRLDMAATLAETLVQQPQGASVAIDLLEPMLPVEGSLPLDRATARALVALGDAAARVGDDALAAGSYARAIRLMSLLRQELEP